MKRQPPTTQGDLFLVIAEPRSAPHVDGTKGSGPVKRRVKDSQRASFQQFTGPKADTAIARCFAEIAGNWHYGRTRQEIADRAGVKLQTVCGCVGKLLHDGRVFEPVIGFDDHGRARHWQRDGRNVLVNTLYQHTWALAGLHEDSREGVA